MKTFAITYLTERQARSQVSLAIIENTLYALIPTGYIENTASHGSRAKLFISISNIGTVFGRRNTLKEHILTLLREVGVEHLHQSARAPEKIKNITHKGMGCRAYTSHLC